MAKKVTAIVKLQLPAGKATPGPPVGSTLGPHGINIPGFTKEFNAKTQDQAGLIIPVVMTIYQDRSFTFVLKTPPAPVLIKKATSQPPIKSFFLRKSSGNEGFPDLIPQTGFIPVEENQLSFKAWPRNSSVYSSVCSKKA